MGPLIKTGGSIFAFCLLWTLHILDAEHQWRAQACERRASGGWILLMILRRIKRSDWGTSAQSKRTAIHQQSRSHERLLFKQPLFLGGFSQLKSSSVHFDLCLWLKNAGMGNETVMLECWQLFLSCCEKMILRAFLRMCLFTRTRFDHGGLITSFSAM